LVEPLAGAALGNGRVLVRTQAGFPLLCSANDLSLTPELMLHGQYDRPLTRFLETRLADGHVAFDVGANIGLFTTLMARLVGPRGHVVAYEAAPENHELLVDNISMNYLTERCTLLKMAAWHCHEKLQFSLPKTFKGNGSLVMSAEQYRERYPGDELHVFEVQAVPVAERICSFERVAVMKIDVEGAEFRILQGLHEELVHGRLKSVVFECVRALLGADFDPLLSYLSQLTTRHGFGCFRLDEDGRTLPLPLSVIEQHGNFTQVVLMRP
jgi:FkbM family methyltransferase